MANKDVVIRISATDAASPTFRKIAGDAKAMGASVEQSATQSARGLDQLDKKAAAVGAAIGSATMLLGEWSRAAAQDEANQARLQQAIENTGKSYDEYADAVDKAIKKGQEKAFSDDDTREALVRLNAVTNDTGKSLDQLGLVMDFARQRGISLADSAGIISKVMGGNVSILQRYGIAVEDGSTATEALAMVQQRAAGQADVYANSQLGQLDKMKDKWDELTESIGGSTGELQGFLMLLPGLSAGYTALAGVIGSLGGLKALSTLGALGIGAGAAYLVTDALINQGTTGSRASFTAVNYGLYGAGSAINAVLPGNPIDTQKYMDTLASNAVEDVVKGLFYFAPTDSVGNRDLFERLRTAGIIQGGAAPEGSKGDKYIQDQFLAIQQTAGQQGLTTGQYIEGKLNSAGSNFIFDQVSGRWMDLGEYQIYQEARMKAARADTATGAIYGPPDPVQGTSIRPRGTGPGGQDIGYSALQRIDLAGPGGQPTGNSPFSAGSSSQSTGGMAIGGAASKDMSGFRTGPADSATYSVDAEIAAEHKRIVDVLGAENAAYIGLVEGINSANDAQSAFKATQDGLIQQGNVYGAQVSEYNSQLNAQENAYDILSKRQEEGIELTKDQTEFMNNYAKATELGTSSAEDAAISQGMLAQQYLLNIENGRAMNEALGAQKGSIDDLVTVIENLILAMDGVPDEIKTEIYVNRADEAEAALQRITDYLNGLDGRGVTFFVNAQGNGLSLGSPTGVGITDVTGMNGLTMNAYAGGGTVYGGNHALVGERGPEIVWLPNGAQVMNTEGSKSRMAASRPRGNGSVNIYGSVNLQMNNPDVYSALSSQMLGGAR